MSITDHQLFIVQAAGGAIASLPVFWWGIRPIYKKIRCFFKRIVFDGLTSMVNDIVTKTIHPYIRELIPNGGSSLNDTIKLQILPMVKEMKEEIGKQGRQLSKLEGRFEQYVDDSESDRPK